MINKFQDFRDDPLSDRVEVSIIPVSQTLFHRFVAGADGHLILVTSRPGAEGAACFCQYATSGWVFNGHVFIHTWAMCVWVPVLEARITWNSGNVQDRTNNLVFLSSCPEKVLPHSTWGVLKVGFGGPQISSSGTVNGTAGGDGPAGTVLEVVHHKARAGADRSLPFEIPRPVFQRRSQYICRCLVVIICYYYFC